MGRPASHKADSIIVIIIIIIIIIIITIFHISDHDKYAPKYSQGASSYSIRAPTGVDLALGLSGYDKLGKNLPPERIPTTLQSYKDSDMMRKKSVNRRKIVVSFNFF